MASSSPGDGDEASSLIHEASSSCTTTTSSISIAGDLRTHRTGRVLRNEFRFSKATVPMVLIHLQEIGIRLVHVLLGYVEAIQKDKPGTAEALVKQVGVLAMSQGSTMCKVAIYFADPLGVATTTLGFWCKAGGVERWANLEME